MTQLLLGDCLGKLKELPDNSVDSIVTDPPYGLSFMGKKWDYDVPSTEIWKECLRVLKPGGHMLAFFGTRTYHRGVVRIEDAGFEIRDQIQWIYGSGFPKSHNLKDEWQGWGTAFKPANEPIVVARKPLEKGLTVAENVVKWGTGAINVDGSRIGTSADMNPNDFDDSKRSSPKFSGKFNNGDVGEFRNRTGHVPNGRWPANVIFDEAAAEMLDEQSGVLKTGGNGRSKKSGFQSTIVGGVGLHDNRNDNAPTFAGDSGGASRFFYVAKASKSERNAGLEGMPEKPMNTYNFSEDGSFTQNATAKTGQQVREPRQNFHPTVKPVRLMSYLIKLVTPPNGTVLDLFMGSGSTGVAAKKLGFGFVGIELSEEYFEIAEKRITKESEICSKLTQLSLPVQS